MASKFQMNLVREDNNDPANDNLFKAIYNHPFNGNIKADEFNLQLIASIYNIEIGKGGNHIWVSDKDKRLMIIYY